MSFLPCQLRQFYYTTVRGDRIEWPGDIGVEFHLSPGDWIRLLGRSGFEIEELAAVRPETTATTRYPFVTLEWARRWPCEEVWKARRRA